jgi:thiamine phosphate synthase YjbQ (UPF0047 family)
VIPAYFAGEILTGAAKMGIAEFFALASTAVAIVSGVVNVIQKLKRREIEGAYDDTQTTLATLISAIETAPGLDNIQKSNIKRYIKQLSETMDVEEGTLKPLVVQITAGIESMLPKDKQLTADVITRKNAAKSAIKGWKESRGMYSAKIVKAPVKSVIPLLFVALVSVFAFSGCRAHTCPASPFVDVQIVTDDETGVLFMDAEWSPLVSQDIEDFDTLVPEGETNVHTVAPLATQIN